MILEARERQSLAEVLVIASRLTRAGRARPAARSSSRPPTRSTSKFDDEKSEFSGYLKLWKWLEEGRGAHGHAGQSSRLAQAQQPPAGAAAARQLRQAAARARMARHPFAAAHRGGRARLAPERDAGHLRADAPGAAGRAARQHRLQERRRRLVPRRARHQVLAPPGRAPEQEAGALDRRGRAGRDHAPVRPRPRGDRAAVDARRSPATC